MPITGEGLGTRPKLLGFHCIVVVLPSQAKDVLASGFIREQMVDGLDEMRFRFRWRGVGVEDGSSLERVLEVAAGFCL